MGYLSIRQTSEKWNLSPRWINDLCSDGRIPGAMKIGSYWAIPEEDVYKRQTYDAEAYGIPAR